MAAVALVGVLGIVFRTAILSQYSGLPAGFEGPGVFRVRYVLEHFRLLLDPVHAYSYWSGGINTQLGSYLGEIYQALLLGISEWSSQPPSLLNQLVLTTCLTTFAFILLAQGRQSVRVADAALVAALATIGTPLVTYYVTGWNVAYGWVFLLAVTAVVASSLSTRSKIVLTFVLTMAGPPVYHSFGFLLILYVITVWVLARLNGLRGLVVSPFPVIVGYAAYLIYVSIQFFGELVRSLRDLITLAFLQRDPGVIALTPATFMGIQLAYIHLVLYGLLVAPILVQIYRFSSGAIRRREGFDARSRNALVLATATTALALAVLAFALAFGTRFSGEQLVSRGASYVIVPALVAIIAELREEHRWRAYIYPLAIAVLLLSAFSFVGQASSVFASTRITVSEADGYRWLKDRLNSTDVVLTDFRLSGPFIADGHLRVVGIHGEGVEPTAQLLDDVYYKSTPASIGPALDSVRTYDQQAPDYVFVSRLMTRDFPALTGYGTQFPPMPERFFMTLTSSPAWEVVYDIGDAVIYKRLER